MKEYIFTARAKASAIIPFGEGLDMDFLTAGRRLNLKMFTRRVGPGGSTLGDLTVIGRAEAETLEDAATQVTRAREMAMFVSIASNAMIGDLEPEHVYEVTPGVTERDFLQRFIPADELSYADRSVPVGATAAFIFALTNHAERDRLIRAISQYSDALARWQSGNELSALSHLFMGVEAIKTACWRDEISRRGISAETLAIEWGFDGAERLRLEQFLDQNARVRLVFEGDREHHRIAKKVSDDFEHGFQNAGKLFAPSRGALVPTARYLRKAILKMVGMDATDEATLLGDRYLEPRGPAQLEMYLRGKLIGDGTILAEDGYDHPFCDWNLNIETTRNEDGSHSSKFSPKLTVRIAEKMTFKPTKMEVFARGVFNPPSATEQRD
jgi:hypothetical protein